MAADKNFIVSTGSSGDDIAADDKENVFGVFNDVAVFYYFWC